MKYKGLIFDFNGVLWWDTEIQEEAWQETALSLRGQLLSEQELQEHLHGRNNKHTLEFLTGKEIMSKAELERLTELKEQNYRQKCLQMGTDFNLAPGARDLLDYLKVNYIPITIATASEINNLRFFFVHLNLGKWFSINNVIYDNGKRPGKPAPDIYLDAAGIINLPPKDCIVIEDSKSGMQAAVAANIGYLIARGPLNKHSGLKQIPGVNAVINTLDEVIRLSLFDTM